MKLVDWRQTPIVLFHRNFSPDFVTSLQLRLCFDLLTLVVPLVVKQNLISRWQNAAYKPCFMVKQPLDDYVRGKVVSFALAQLCFNSGSVLNEPRSDQFVLLDLFCSLVKHAFSTRSQTQITVVTLGLVLSVEMEFLGLGTFERCGAAAEGERGRFDFVSKFMRFWVVGKVG